MPFDGTDFEYNSAAALIRQGMRRIASGSWSKGPIFGDGRYCILTSLPISLSKDNSATLFCALAELTRQARKRNFLTTYQFNDHPETSYEDAMQLMEDAAQELETVA